MEVNFYFHKHPWKEVNSGRSKAYIFTSMGEVKKNFRGTEFHFHNKSKKKSWIYFHGLVFSSVAFMEVKTQKSNNLVDRFDGRKKSRPGEGRLLAVNPFKHE